MSLLPDWKAIIKRAWSMRLMAIAAVLQGLSVVLPLLFDPYQSVSIFGISISPSVFAVIIFCVIVAALFARVTKQRGLSDE